MAEKKATTEFYRDPVTGRVVEIGTGGVEDTRKRILTEQYGWTLVDPAENPQVGLPAPQPEPVSPLTTTEVAPLEPEPEPEPAPKKAAKK